ncbi:MAG TPA: sigma-E factor regulatory protein RseB domain-containing protein [Trebonia sp.]
MATVTVPGLLAMLAVVGHEHVAAEAGVNSAALDGTPLSGPFPVAPATARAAVRNNIAAVQRADGLPVTVFNRVTVSQQVEGMRLLDSAAAASLSTSYHGTELISQSSVDGSVKTVSQVWHQGGGVTLVETSDTTSAAAPPANVSVASSDPASESPEGVFGVTKSLMALLGKHYVAVDRGGGTAVGRKATVVDLYRFDGSVAARYWLDKQTEVPLRRELFGTSDEVISQDSFVQVKFGALAVPRLMGAGAIKAQSLAQAAEPSVAQPAWVATAPGQVLASLAGKGWQVPGSLPGDLPLYAAALSNTASGEVVDLEYSDGLYVVSVFAQRGTLAAKMPGWRPVNVGGQQAFVSGHSVTWAVPGFVYTVIADAPPQTVTQVVKALPRDSSPGVLDRLGRGFIRIARAFNPFG